MRTSARVYCVSTFWLSWRRHRKKRRFYEDEGCSAYLPIRYAGDCYKCIGDKHIFCKLAFSGVCLPCVCPLLPSAAVLLGLYIRENKKILSSGNLFINKWKGNLGVCRGIHPSSRIWPNTSSPHTNSRTRFRNSSHHYLHPPQAYPYNATQCHPLHLHVKHLLDLQRIVNLLNEEIRHGSITFMENTLDRLDVRNILSSMYSFRALIHHPRPNGITDRMIIYIISLAIDVSKALGDAAEGENLLMN
jgi:hypothetical protein